MGRKERKTKTRKRKRWGRGKGNKEDSERREIYRVLLFRSILVNA